jgi:hypothetical protein
VARHSLRVRAGSIDLRTRVIQTHHQCRELGAAGIPKSLAPRRLVCIRAALNARSDLITVRTIARWSDLAVTINKRLLGLSTRSNCKSTNPSHPRREVRR